MKCVLPDEAGFSWEPWGLSQWLIPDSRTTLVLTAFLRQNHPQKHFKHPIGLLSKKKPKIGQLHLSI